MSVKRTRKARKRARDAEAFPPRPPHSHDIQITKLDAAQRQLRTAIRLWFEDGDPVSIHTLVHAAHELVHALYKQKGLSDLLFDSRLIKDEFRGVWNARIKSSATFFKHAQRDIDEELAFNPDINEDLLVFTVEGLLRMGEKPSVLETALMQWVCIQRPDLLLPEGRRFFDEQIPVDSLKEVRSWNKHDFLERYEMARSLQDAGLLDDLLRRLGIGS